MSDKPNDLVVVGIDDGHSGIKVFYVDKDGKKHQFKMLSKGIVGVVRYGDEANVNEEVVSVDGVDYTISETLQDCDNTRNEDYPISKLNRALVYQALRNAKLSSKKLIIGTGLPVDRFYTNKSMNKPLIESKKANLLNMSGVFNKKDKMIGVSQIEIDKHIVFCEANSAYYDVLFDLNDKGGLIVSQIAKDYEIFEYGSAVIDIGGRTTDCVVVNPNGKTLNASRSGTIDVGMLDFIDSLRQEIQSTYKMKFISEKALMEAISTGVYKVGQNVAEISNIVNKHKKSMMEKLENFIESTVGDASDVPVIILVGGGAYTFGEMIEEKFGNVVIPKDAEFSNARGFYKLLKHIFK